MPAPSRLKPVPPVDCACPRLLAPAKHLSEPGTNVGARLPAMAVGQTPSMVLTGRLRGQARSYKYGGSQHYFVCRHSSAAGSDARPCGTGFSREGVRWYATELVLTTNYCRSALARDGGGSDAIDVSDQTLSRASALLHIQRQPALFVCRHCSTAGRVGPALAGKAVGPHPNLRPVRVMCQRWSSNLLYALPMRRTRYPHTITRARRYSPCVMPTPVLKARS